MDKPATSITEDILAIKELADDIRQSRRRALNEFKCPECGGRAFYECAQTKGDIFEPPALSFSYCEDCDWEITYANK